MTAELSHGSIRQTLRRLTGEPGLAAAGRLSVPEPRIVSTPVVEVDRGRLYENRVMALFPETLAADAYKLLRARILRATKQRGLNTLLVTSPMPGEGKTLTALNLAVTFALDTEQTAILVEADLRHPSLAHLLGIESTAGLAEYLRGDVPLAGLLLNLGFAKCTVLLAGGRTAGSTELLESPKMGALLAELKARYVDQYVIIDGPPVLTSPDALVLSWLTDGAILVAEIGKTTEEQVKEAADLLKDKNLLGIVLNKALVTPGPNRGTP